jgi:lipoate-protein ligase A
MNWIFLNSGNYSGKFNMETDIFLAMNCEPDEAVFRLYRWHPYCVSLGANQNEIIINYDETRKDNIDVVKRPTGGKAILHAEEITYSVVYPTSPESSAREIYTDINFALKKGLEKFDKRLSETELENYQPDFPKLYKENLGSICFASSAKSELKYKEKKLVGSAQRKFKNSILQHGSILCGSYHKNIIKYLNISPEEKDKFKSEIDKRTIDLNTILNENIDYDLLSGALISGFREYFNITSLQYV